MLTNFNNISNNIYEVPFSTGGIIGAIFNDNSTVSNNLNNQGEIITNIINCNLITRTENNNRMIATGGIVGYMYQSTLKEIYNNNKVSISSTSSQTRGTSCGGTIGVCDSSSVENAYNYQEVYTGSDSASDCRDFAIGGIAGGIWFTADNVPLITKCANRGNIKGEIYCNTEDSCIGVGGICGSNYDLSQWRDTGTINQCYNLGSVHGTLNARNNNVGLVTGGIVGYNAHQQGNISSCYNKGEITTGATNIYGWIDVGGIAGWGNGSVTNCYNATENIHAITASPYTTPNYTGICFIQAWSSWIDNCFYLETKKTDSNYATGAVANETTINGTATEKTSNELKELADTLGAIYWEKDTQNKNEGYPILKNNKP